MLKFARVLSGGLSAAFVDMAVPLACRIGAGRAKPNALTASAD